MHPNNEKKDFTDMLSRYLNNTATEAEKARVLAWIESLNEEERIELSDQSRTEISNRMWSAVNEKLEDTSTVRDARTVRMYNTGLIWRVAASVIIVLGFSLYYSLEYYSSDKILSISRSEKTTTQKSAWKEIKNTTDKSLDVNLEDGSRVVLEPLSTLEYLSFAGADERTVRLKGEAYFEVAPDPDHAFVVYSDEVVTRVLGTRFTVRAPGDGRDISVMVSSGKVSVTGPTGSTSKQELILTPNQEAVYSSVNQTFLKNIIQKNTIAEVSKLVFDEEPVGNILRLFEDAYEIDIEFNEALLNDCMVTTAFKDEGLYERLTILTRIIGASYSEVDGKIIVESSGCN